jgi:Domain of unknown function (DUF397)
VSEFDPPKWRKSTRCAQATCVEVARVDKQYLVRDSKRPELAPLAFTEEEWHAFVEGVKAGEFRF